jgi:hypothetical protein
MGHRNERGFECHILRIGYFTATATCDDEGDTHKWPDRSNHGYSDSAGPSAWLVIAQWNHPVPPAGCFRPIHVPLNIFMKCLDSARDTVF